MGKVIRVTWEVDDGYAGGARPQTLEIPAEELEGLENEERESMIHNMVQEEFEQRISWYIKRIE